MNDINADPLLLKGYLARMPRESLVKLNSASNPTDKNLPAKVKMLKSLVFTQAMQQISLKESKIKEIHALIEEICHSLYMNAYMTDDLTISWSKMREETDDAIKQYDTRVGGEQALAAARGEGAML